MSSFSVSLSPHVRDSASTRRIMLQVCLALLPALAFGVWAFGLYALLVVALSVASAVGTEALVGKKAWVRGQICPGIPVWQTDRVSKFPRIPYVIFPGNVGDAETLRRAVEILTEA